MISGHWAQAHHSVADSAFATHDNLISHNNLSRSSRGVNDRTGKKSINPVLTERKPAMTHVSLRLSSISPSQQENRMTVRLRFDRFIIFFFVF